VADIAALPIQDERRRRWKLHNSLKSREPMLLVFPEGAWRELLPDSVLKCEEKYARGIEWELRRRIYCHEHFVDDSVTGADWPVHKSIKHTGWGLEQRRIPSPDKLGAWHFDPVMNEYGDLKKLRAPEVSYNEKETQQWLADTQELFGDILKVSLQGIASVHYSLIMQYSSLRGLDRMFYDLIEEPKFVHDFLDFVTVAHQKVLAQYVKLNLLTLNNN
jgi:hypothetical protein